MPVPCTRSQHYGLQVRDDEGVLPAGQVRGIRPAAATGPCHDEGAHRQGQGLADPRQMEKGHVRRVERYQTYVHS